MRFLRSGLSLRNHRTGGGRGTSSSHYGSRFTTTLIDAAGGHLGTGRSRNGSRIATTVIDLAVDDDVLFAPFHGIGPCALQNR